MLLCRINVTPLGSQLLDFVRCQNPGDGCGDLMIEIPQVVLTTMGVGLGDGLSTEKVGDVITLKPIRDGQDK